MNIIEIHNLSKKYIIGHDKAASGMYKYSSLRDAIAHTCRGMAQRIRHPLSPNTETTALEEFWALKDINLEIEQGDKVGIIGRNGAGKSTLLKVLSRITEPTSGNFTIKGRIASLLEVGTGFHPELSGRENIYLNGAILGMTRKEIKKNFDEIVDFSGVEKFLDTPVKRFSSGMYVRLAFAVAAHLDPEILLIDEVLAVGDAEFQKKCLGKMDEVSKQGRTILFVSHNMAAIQQLCTKGILLDKGIVVKNDIPNRVVEYYLNPHNAEKDKANIVFPNIDKKEFQMLKLEVKNINNQHKTIFSCDEDICLEMLCFSKKPIPGLYGTLVIYNDEGIHILQSDTYDLGGNKLENLPSGEYKIEVIIPKRSLGSGRYHVMINFTSNFSANGFWIDSHERACSFTLNDNKTLRGDSRAGYFSTLLKWDVAKS